MDPKPSSTILLVRDNPYGGNIEVLLMQRRHSMSFGGAYAFPGGKLELGETLQECIKRELKEELGIEAEVGDLYMHYNYEYPHISYDLHFFKIRKYKGTIIKTAHDKLEWAKLEDFYRYNFLPGDNPLIDKLKQEL